jgi:hypothetical protein
VQLLVEDQEVGVQVLVEQEIEVVIQLLRHSILTKKMVYL